MGGFDVVSFQNSGASSVTIDLAAGSYVADVAGNFFEIEGIRGTDGDDVYVATGFDKNSANAGSTDIPDNAAGTLNEFEGVGGADTVTGNGDTRIAFYHAGNSISCDLSAGQATGFGTVTITGGVNRVAGSEFNDVITGDGNANFLDGWYGNDQLTGQGGADTFIFSTNTSGAKQGGGQDTIEDYVAGTDKIDLRGVATVHTYGDLSISESADGSTIDFGSGNTLFLVSVTKATLDTNQGDFLFS